MVFCECDICGYKATAEKAHGGQGRTWRLPSHSWMSMKNGVVCSTACYYAMKEKDKNKPVPEKK